MSETAEDDDDLRAAEYVLGVLDADDASLLRAEAARKPAMARAIAAWENRLAPLANTVTPLTPPEALWLRIEESLASAVIIPFAPRARTDAPVTAPVNAPFSPPGNAPANAPMAGPASPPARDRALARRVEIWKAATAAALAVAASLLVVIVWPTPPTDRYVASLGAANAPSASFLAEAKPDGSIILTALYVAAKPSDKDLELWALPAGASRPISLGVIPAGDRYTVKRPDLAQGRTQLLVSLEPLGGSPSGQPTGPVLYAGTLVAAD